MNELPTLKLVIKKSSTIFELPPLLKKCSLFTQSYQQQHKSNQWCSLVRPMAKNADDSPDIVLGSQFLREYYVVIDNQLSRIGLAPKKSQWCEVSENTDSIITINDSPNVRLAVNISLFAVVFFTSIKVTGGCLQFFDFGSHSNSGSSNSSQRNQVDQGATHQNNQPRNGPGGGHESLDEDSTSQIEDSTVNNNQVLSQFQNIREVNSRLNAAVEPR